MKSSPAAAAVVGVRGAGPRIVSNGIGDGNPKWPNRTNADIASGARCAASCATTEPYDQPNSTGAPATLEVLATHRQIVMASATARSGLSHPDESRGVPP